MTRPSANPITVPKAPKNAASARNAAITPNRVVPTARRMPISVCRRTTETEIV